MADYRLGSTDPVIRPDPGAGAWGSVTPTIAMRALKAEIMAHLAEAYIVIGRDAAAHLAHFLGNSGRLYTIRLDDMIPSVPSAQALLNTEVADARRFVESLAVGTHQFCSGRARNGYDTKNESWNWFYAVGGYSAWGKGVAQVLADSSGRRRYRMEFDYRFFDRYNWDRGKSVTIFGITITDEFMGEFHRQGLAKEFDMTGTVRRQVEWAAGTAHSITTPGAGGRS